MSTLFNIPTTANPVHSFRDFMLLHDYGFEGFCKASFKAKALINTLHKDGESAEGGLAMLRAAALYAEMSVAPANMALSLYPALLDMGDLKVIHIAVTEMSNWIRYNLPVKHRTAEMLDEGMKKFAVAYNDRQSTLKTRLNKLHSAVMKDILFKHWFVIKYISNYQASFGNYEDDFLYWEKYFYEKQKEKTNG